MIVNTLITDRKVVRAVLGISYLASEQARALGINAGVLVLDLPEGSPATNAGLKGTQLILEIIVFPGDGCTALDVLWGTSHPV